MGRELHSSHRFHLGALLLAAVVHLITAWHSTGYHSADEHFQVVAFAQWKLGELPAEHLPWEFAERIRSSVQPWIATLILKTASTIGIKDPFNKAFMLRLLTALLALIAVRGFVNATMASVQEPLRKAYILLSYFLWFLPFLHVRFAGEAWASICLLQGLIALYRNEEDRHWTWRVGIWFTLAACLRPGLLPATAGIGLWILFIRKPKFIVIGKAALASAFVLLVTYGLDTLFYDVSTFSFGRYLDANFPSHPGHVFDDFPWWYYAPWIVKYAIPPIGASMLLGVILYVLRHPRSVITWCTVPLLVALSIVPHKELRFLYGIADLVPLILVMGLGESMMHLRGSFMKWGMRVGLGILIASNVVGLLMVMTSPAGEGRANLAKALHTDMDGRPARLGYLVPPDIAWRIELPSFYELPSLTEVVFDPGTSDKIPIEIGYLMAHPDDVAAFEQRQQVLSEFIARPQPVWAEDLFRLYTWDEGPSSWELYRIDPAP